MARSVIAWDPTPREIAADPAATLSVDRARWEAAGARFDSYEDEIGGETAVATASLSLPAGDVEFGVLDYGAPTSYLIVAGSYAEHSTAVDVVLQALTVDDIIAADDIVERLPSEFVDSEPTPTQPSSNTSWRSLRKRFPTCGYSW